MLCSRALAELAARAPPPGPPAGVPLDDVASSSFGSVDSAASSDSVDSAASSDSLGSAASSAAPPASLGSEASTADAALPVGVPRPASGHSRGHIAAIRSVNKWVLAALRHLGRDRAALCDPETLAPNDQLASEVLSVLARWRVERKTARDAGVQDPRAGVLKRRAPDDVLDKARSWLRLEINTRRAARLLRVLPDWARELAYNDGNVRAVKDAKRADKMASGRLFHGKQDLAPTLDQLAAMTFCGFLGDARVDADVLDAVEGAMAVGLYLPTGARGAELKTMHLQSTKKATYEDERSGLAFEGVRMTAFETKTKEHHLNQVLPHSNPWRCGVGLFGLSLLVRARRHGPPPVAMGTDAASWRVLGTSAATLDRRINDVFRVAGVERQVGDPVTYLGRHHGTRLLQHAGGTAEGGAIRRGHGNGTASFAYTECPLPDLLRLAGNDPAAPFTPAHLHASLRPAADAVLAHLLPALDAHDARASPRAPPSSPRCAATRAPTGCAARSSSTTRRSSRARSASRAAPRSAASSRGRARGAGGPSRRTRPRCGSARPRPSSASSRSSFGGAPPEALRAMNELAGAVRARENAELAARRAAPAGAAVGALVDAVRDLRAEADAREARFLADQQRVLEALLARAPPAATRRSPRRRRARRRPRRARAAGEERAAAAEAAAAAPPLARARRGQRAAEAAVASRRSTSRLRPRGSASRTRSPTRARSSRRARRGGRPVAHPPPRGRRARSVAARCRRVRCYRALALAVGGAARKGAGAEEARTGRRGAWAGRRARAGRERAASRRPRRSRRCRRAWTPSAHTAPPSGARGRAARRGRGGRGGASRGPCSATEARAEGEEGRRRRGRRGTVGPRPSTAACAREGGGEAGRPTARRGVPNGAPRRRGGHGARRGRRRRARGRVQRARGAGRRRRAARPLLLTLALQCAALRARGEPRHRLHHAGRLHVATRLVAQRAAPALVAVALLQGAAQLLACAARLRAGAPLRRRLDAMWAAHGAACAVLYVGFALGRAWRSPTDALRLVALVATTARPRAPRAAAARRGRRRRGRRRRRRGRRGAGDGGRRAARHCARGAAGPSCRGVQQVGAGGVGGGR